MYKYGVPDGANISDLEREFEAMSKYLEDLLQDSKAIQEIDRSARMARYLSSEDLERQFTC